MLTYTTQPFSEGGHQLFEDGVLKAVILNCPNHPEVGPQLDLLKELYPDAAAVLDNMCCCDEENKENKGIVGE